MSALLLLLLAFGGSLVPAAAPAADNPLTPLTVYAGTWTVDSPHPAAGAAKSDTVVNHCSIADAFYTCEQVVNGKAVALLVFTATAKPGEFHTTTVLPSGHARGPGDLTIAGSHWTYLSKDVGEKTTTWYRTENFFKDRDHIRYEQSTSADGVSWTRTGGGDEVRVSAIPAPGPDASGRP